MTETTVGQRRNAWSAPFWEGVEQKELRFQHCEGCGRNVFPARRHCPRCASTDLSWRESKGEGTIYSFSVLELGAIGAFAGEVPYVIVVIDMAEGFRMTSRLRTDDFTAIRCDMPVRIQFPDSGSLPVFVPLEHG